MSETTEDWPFDATTGPGETLYEYTGTGNSQPVLVGVTGPAGSTDLISTCGTLLGRGSIEFTNALSADGGTVFFTAEECASGSGANAGVPVPANAVYARIDRARTVLVSGRSPLGCTSAQCLASPVGAAAYQNASIDGSKVFFTSTQQLTNGASEDNSGDTALGRGCSKTTGANGCNLYEYDFNAPAGDNLIDVSAGDTSGGGPRVQGVMAVSSDGSHVYFVAKGVLTGAANSQGQSALDEVDNLYVFERDASHPEGHVAFVATLSESDFREWYAPSSTVANVTPDGRFLVFRSHGALTADDSSTTGAAQVFRYDAQTGELTRLSIGENGFNDGGNAGTAAAEASIVSSFYASLHGGPARADPTMSHDGAYVFFQSPVALTPHALDEVQIGTMERGQPVYAQNVYEWHASQVYLISDGRDVSEERGASAVKLLGSDATGANVFFATADQLAVQDTDTELDVYDARICTSGEPCVVPSAPPPPCQGEACHGTPGVAPPAPGAATVTFAGPGNLAPAQATVVKPRAKHKTKAKRRKAKRRKSRPKSKTGSRGRSARGGSHAHINARGR